jgi:hypothetical protein
MRPSAAVAVLLLVSGVAHAEERATTITLGGMAGAIERTHHDYDYSYTQADPLVGPRLSLAWEHAQLEMPATPGYKFGGSIVPELIGGAFFDDDKAQMFIGAGVRAELKMAQREMGLLRVSARGAVYLAARGLVVGDERKGFAEFTVGESLMIGRATRIGIEAGLIAGRATEMSEYGGQDNIGPLVHAYVGFQP